MTHAGASPATVGNTHVSTAWDDIKVSHSGGQGNGPVDWKDLKRRIIVALGDDGVYREFGNLGVKFEGTYNTKGKAECHAMDRPDERPSAFVDVRHGIYHSQGGASETLNLFDFALKYGGATFGDWLRTMKHFAALVNIPVNAGKDSKGKVLEEVYNYLDARGESIYQVLRYRLSNGKKDFRQRRPDGKGDWIWDLEGVARVLYRLPEILANPGHHVWITEGEKDADRLNQEFLAGAVPIVATTSSQGANDTDRWYDSDDYAEVLRGRACVVFADNDPGGLVHAKRIATRLLGVADSVKLVELPGVGPKGDVSDWLDQGHALDDLWELVAGAPAWDPKATTSPSGFRKHTMPLREVKDEDVDWFYEDRIAPGFITIFAGRTGLGKSFVTCDIVARLSRGESPPCSSVRHPPMNVLFISEDSPSIVLGPRLRRFRADEDRIHFMRWESLAEYTLGDTKTLEEAYLECGEPKVIVIDPPSSFLGDIDEHRNSEVRGVCKLVIAWLEKHHVACIFITHINKQIGKGLDAVERIMGSVAWGTSARMTLAFVKDPDTPDQWVFGGTKNNVGKIADVLAYRFAVDPHDPKKVTIEWAGKVDTTIENAMNNVSRKSRGVCAVEWLMARFTERAEWESDELKREAREAGISKNALWSPEVNDLPIEKKKRTNASGDTFWVWRSLDNWPNTNGNVGTNGKVDDKVF